MRDSPSSGPYEPRVGLDCSFVLLPLILRRPHLRGRLCVCACICLDICSLSLSHYYLLRSLCISLSSLHVSARMSLQKKGQVQS
jgi:hypothetical protein